MISHYVAKQPILNRDNEVFAYELLYRDSEHNAFPAGLTDEQASARIFFETALFHGITNVAEKKLAFVNLCDKSVLKKLPHLIPPTNLVVEIVERSGIDEETLQAIIELHKQGYVFALDDYDFADHWQQLEPYLSFVKFDVPEKVSEIGDAVQTIRKRFPKVQLVAERVENKQQANMARMHRVEYLQGYFFSKPQVTKFSDIDPSKSVALELISCLNQTLLNFNDVAAILARDLSLTARVIKLANVSLAYRGLNISSISKAVVYLGEETMRQFISVVAVSQLSSDKPAELVILGVTRAHFIKELPTLFKQPNSETGFLVGMLSVLDGVLDLPIEDVIKKLQLQPKIAQALLRNEGTWGEALALIKAVEQAQWDEIEERLKVLTCKAPQAVELDRLFIESTEKAQAFVDAI